MKTGVFEQTLCKVAASPLPESITKIIYYILGRFLLLSTIKDMAYKAILRAILIRQIKCEPMRML